MAFGQAAPRPARIIDTHTHFYDPSRPQGVPWPLKDDQLLYRTVLPGNYRALEVPQPVDGTVVVEASPWVEDNQWVLDLAEREKFIVGFIGNLPAGTPEFAGLLKRFAANPLFRGIRLSGIRLSEGLASGGAGFLDDLKRLAEAELVLDVVHLREHLPAVGRLARAVPRLRIVIDHVANVAIDGRAAPAEWAGQLAEVAQSRNVACKVSGLVEGTGRKDGSAPDRAEFYLPVLNTVWRAFGAERLVYGSNWPVCERFAPLGRVQLLAMGYFAAKGETVMDQVFWQNALAIYRWVRR